MVGQICKRVLLVDDDPLIRKFMSGYLVGAGHVVQTAVDGLDAITKLRAGLPDLIISDLNMPRMSGHELLPVVRKRFPQIPVIVISAVAANGMPREVAADVHYQKRGFRFHHLLETISDLARKTPLRTGPPRVNNEPTPARWDGDGNYVIRCEDCLREFSIPRVFQNGRGEKCTICVHCGKVIHFIVMDRDSHQL